MMKRFLLATTLCLTMSLGVFAQGMSDQQVLAFIASEAKAGTSQAQIVTKLMQKGVRIDQIRRLRNEYDKQISSRGLSAAADGAVTMAAERMQGNSDGTTSQEVTTARVGTTGTIENDAVSEVQAVENDVQATQGTAPDANGKQVFGRDIFSQANPNFQPNVNMPIPDNYVLGPGDQVVVDIYGASQNTLIHTISPEGTITVSGYGPIYLSGLSVAGAQSKLRSTIGSRYQSSNLKVSVGNTRTIQVNIMGEVRAPGTYHLSAFANVFYALYRAGGTSSLGTLRNIKVYRNGRLVTVVDLYDYILNGRLAGNIRLQDNDVIQVEPYQALVGITGNVKRPMFYEMRKDESVATLIKYAGGFTSEAHKKSVRLVREAGERYAVYNVSEFDMSTFKLEDGDNITVDGMINRFENMVEIKGAVFRPGQFQLGANITSVRSLIEAAEGLTEDAFADHAIIHRLKADRTLEILSLDVKGIMEGTVPDVPLQNEDVVFIPTQEELRKERNFTITGEVMNPGTYEYADNTTVEDLIVQAGGLRDGANLSRVDVSRRINDPKATKKTTEIAQTFTFELKDGLLVSGDKEFTLEPYDVVHVRRSPAYVMPRNITVNGEVNSRILTDRGDSIAWNKVGSGDTYVVGIELDEALKNPGGDKDVFLREGDAIFVPEYTGTVTISGEVFYPNTVFYEKGKSYKQYVEMAGGFGHHAKKSRSFIVYQNGTIGIVSDGAKPEPGCEIIVPSKKKKQPINWSAIAAVASSLTGIAAIMLAISRL